MERLTKELEATDAPSVQNTEVPPDDASWGELFRLVGSDALRAAVERRVGVGLLQGRAGKPRRPRGVRPVRQPPRAAAQPVPGAAQLLTGQVHRTGLPERAPAVRSDRSGRCGAPIPRARPHR